MFQLLKQQAKIKTVTLRTEKHGPKEEVQPRRTGKQSRCRMGYAGDLRGMSGEAGMKDKLTRLDFSDTGRRSR